MGCHIKFDLRSKLAINLKTQKSVNLKNNICENNKRIKHTYNKGDLVSLKNAQITKYGQDAYQGQWKSLEVKNNGTVTMKMGRLTNAVNIRQIHPYITI